MQQTLLYKRCRRGLIKRWGLYVVARGSHRILINWNLDDQPTEVEWRFEARDDGTWVEIFNRGFPEGDEGVTAALEATEGFALVLAGAKLWLEKAIEPTYILDRFPDRVRAAFKN